MTTREAPMQKKQKIAILGGGMSALTAAFELTSSKESAERYEITVYQAGHRLGGKGASGRRRENAHRIEEHGLHILMGFYENTFKLLRACYKELGRREGEPLATVEDAFKPHSFIAIAEEVQGKWEPWPLPFPLRPGQPGDGRVELPSPPALAREILHWTRHLLSSSRELKAFTPHIDKYMLELERRLASPRRENTRGGGGGGGDAQPDGERAKLEAVVDEMMANEGSQSDERRSVRSRSFAYPPFTFLELSYRLSRFSAEETWKRVSWLLDRFRRWITEEIASKLAGSTLLRRAFIFFDLGITAIVGMFADGILRAPHDFFAIDDLDLQDWLAKHGASKMTRESALLRSVYNLSFTAPGQGAAGTALQGILRLLFTYRGAVFYKMQAGMGDAVFAPLYLVLKQRGVRFEFFHRVDNIVLSPDKKSVAAVEMGRQATPKGGEYRPLYDVDGLPCWPSEPDHDALVEGKALRASGENLESFWSRWPDVEKKRIEAGRDFDTVILGISIGAFPYLCKELIEANPRFRAMVESVKTTQTQAVQLWLKSSFEELGWAHAAAVLDGFAAPFDTWADMTHLLGREKWEGEEGKKPVALAYLCGRLEDRAPVPPRREAEYPRGEARVVKENALGWLNAHAGGLWPRAVGSGGFDWSKLVDPEERTGAARFEAQYSQATFCPSERYVLSVPGSTKHRLRADESGFERLVLTGDWVLTGLSCGCIEAATMAGMQASRAICGSPEVIVGDIPSAATAKGRARVAITKGGESAGETGGLPLYVERGGEVVLKPPIAMQGTTSYSFILPARQDRLEALCDRVLNGPAGGAAHYVPAGPFVMLVCADIAHGQAREAPHREMGWSSERDVAFWVPVLGGKREGGVFSADRMLWMLTYVFVDNTAAVSIGRELFGYPKAQATLRFPGDPGAGGAFSVDALMLKRFGLESRVEVARLITVTNPKRGAMAGGGDAWASMGEGFEELGKRLASGVLAGVERGATAARLLVDGYRSRGIKMVFLKQFRDARDPARACYQAVIEAPAVVDVWKDGGFLPGHRVTIERAESHPIVEELGLSGGVVESLFGVWLTYDFTAERGVVIGGRE